MRGRLQPVSTEPSVLVFTTRKCASTFLARLLLYLNRRHLGLLHLDLAAYAWETRTEPVAEFLDHNAESLFVDRGIIYGPLRRYVDTAHLAAVRRLAMLRDPRDVIVSDYYSVRFSHRPAASTSRSRDLHKRRAAVAEYSVDDYARAAAPYYHAIFEEYRRNIPRESVLTYEAMWDDFPAWLADLAALLDIQLDEEDRARCVSLFGEGQGSGEDAQRHRRKGVPGDHVDKLSPAVAAELTEQFGDVLDWLQIPARPASAGRA